MNQMHIIKKPRQYKLPFLIQKRMISQENEESIPKVYIQSKIKKKKSKSLISNDKTICYTKGRNIQQYRELIRKSISRHMNFEHDQRGTSNIFPEQIIQKLKQPVKAIQYNTSKFESIYRNVKEIFGQDLQISRKDIIAAYGSITQSFYIFFNSVYYQPFSICCDAVIYMKMQNNELDPSSRLAKLQTSYQFFTKNNNIINRFKCSKCGQIVLNIVRRSEQSLQVSRSIGKKALHFDAQRQKISMSIVIASGKFKRMRIDEMISKDADVESSNRYRNQDNNVMNRNKTLPFRRKMQKLL